MLASLRARWVSLVEYAGAVFSHWKALIVSALGAALAFVAEFHPIVIPLGVWVVVAVAGVLVAQFLAFHDVRLERDNALSEQAVLPKVSAKILVAPPKIRLGLQNEGPGKAPSVLVNWLFPSSWKVFQPADENGYPITRGAVMLSDEDLRAGDGSAVPARLWVYREDEPIHPGITHIYFFRVEAESGDYPTSLRLYPYGAEDLTVTIDPPGEWDQ